MKDKIVDFFYELAINRDEKIESDLIADYEQRMHQLQIGELMKVKEGDSVLDAGCGNLRDANLVLGHNKGIMYFGVDFSSSMLIESQMKHSGRPIFLVWGDITSLPFRSSTFDLVLCSEVLENVPNWKLALLELKCVLKNGGSVIISTPNNFSIYFPQRIYLEKRYGNKHPYDEWKNYCVLSRALKKLGFNIIGARGACYLPGLIAYKDRPKGWIAPFLPCLEKIEAKFLSHFMLSKYLGYIVIIRAVKDFCIQPGTIG